MASTVLLTQNLQTTPEGASPRFVSPLLLKFLGKNNNMGENTSAEEKSIRSVDFSFASRIFRRKIRV